MRKRELRWFDFNPSGGHEGVRAFKKSFDAEAVSCPRYRPDRKWRVFIKKRRKKNKPAPMRILRRGVI